MKRLFPSSLLVFSLLGWPGLRAADSKPTPPGAGSAVAKSSLAGHYAGNWKGPGDSAGDLRIKLRQDDAATWVGEASFTIEGTEIPTKMKSIQADGTKIVMIFDWEIQGTAGQSKASGELKGDALQGTYETSGAAGLSAGTWSVTRK